MLRPDTLSWSNEKKKGQGNQKSGNKYLSWAYAEAATFCIRYCPEAKKHYQRKMAKTNQPSAYRAMANKFWSAHLMSQMVLEPGFLFRRGAGILRFEWT